MNYPEKHELHVLEKFADDLLDEIAASVNDVSESELKKLEDMAGRAAKIAFGSGRAGLLTQQMHTLIRWTDHLDDEVLKKQFKKALKSRPLADPW